MLSKPKSAISEYAKDRGLIPGKFQGLFNKTVGHVLILCVDLRFDGSERLQGGIGGGRPPGRGSSAATPLPDAESSPESSKSARPSTKNENKDTGRWRRTSRAHLGVQRGSRKPREVRLRAEAERVLGKIRFSMLEAARASLRHANGRKMSHVVNKNVTKMSLF